MAEHLLQGRSKSSMLVPPESSSAVLVMIHSESVFIHISGEIDFWCKNCSCIVVTVLIFLSNVSDQIKDFMFSLFAVELLAS